MDEKNKVLGIFNINEKENNLIFSKVHKLTSKDQGSKKNQTSEKSFFNCFYNTVLSFDFNSKNVEKEKIISEEIFNILNSEENKDVEAWVVNKDGSILLSRILSRFYDFEIGEIEELNEKNTYNRIRLKNYNFDSNHNPKINNIKYKEFNVNKKDESVDNVYSFHTFLFPFRLTASSRYLKNLNLNENNYFSKYCTKKIFDKLFKENPHWKKDLIIDDKIEKLVCFEELIDEKTNKIKANYLNDYQKLYRDHYNRIQYFHSAPLKAIYGMSYENIENELLNNYVFRYEGKQHEMELIIGVPEEGEIKTTKYYRLNLNDIRLKVYNTDVAIIIFEVENKLYTELQDIMKINAFTRRVAIPTLNIDADLTPTYWEIRIYDTESDGSKKSVKKVLNDDIWQPYEMVLDEDYDKSKINISKISYTKIIDPIKDLLDIRRLDSENTPGDNALITSWCRKFNELNAKDKECLYIEPVLDDRMYVCSFIKNNDLVNASKNMYYEKDGDYELLEKESSVSKSGVSQKKYPKFKVADKIKYGYQVDYEVAKDLYKVVYIDEKNSSCQSIHMIQKLLGESLYTRWIDEGTIQAVTHHSFMMLSTENCPDYLVNNHLELYVEMGCMVLAQRASILQFQLFASELTEGSINGKEKIKQERINQLLNLQERYIAFQNQLLFFEVSSEEQAIELYDMLFKELYIKEENEELRNQLQSLYEATNVNQDLNFNFYAALVAIISIILSVITFSVDAKDISATLLSHLSTSHKLNLAQWGEGFIRFGFWLLFLGFVYLIVYRVCKLLYNIYEKKLSMSDIIKIIKDVFKGRVRK